jgi:Uma2 family endonuclease
MAQALRLATIADLDGDQPLEIVGGHVVEKASPSFEHGASQRALSQLVGPFHRRGADDGAGGWWIAVEVDIELEAHEIYRPDLVGWRRDRASERPSGRPVRVRPDCVCEILSPSTAARDLGPKMRSYHAHGIGHYWVVDCEHETLTVHRHMREGYVVALVAGRDETVRAEPFDAVEIAVGLLFGLEPPDEA